MQFLLFMSIPGSISLLFTVLFFFQLCLAKTRVDDNYVTTWGEPSNWAEILEKSLKSSVQVSQRISVADDGFQTAYTVVSPRGRKTIGTVLLAHGFDREGRYWIDSGFLQASRLIEQGYRIILPDLMVRGRTRDLNFALDNKGQWNPNDQQRQWLNQVTGDQEARYLLQIFKNEKAEGRVSGPIILGGHSRGALVTGYLAYHMGLENRRAVKNGDVIPWDVRALWSFNGFLIYTAPSIQFLLDSQKSRFEVLESLEKLMGLNSHLNNLRNKDIEKEAASEIKSALLIEEKIKPLHLSYMSSFEGVGKSGFVSYVMREFEDQMNEHGRNRFDSRPLYNRELQLTEAMMVGLRTVYKMNITSGGLVSMSNRNIMIPDSVIGIYRLIQQNKLPGIHNVKIVVGKQDPIIPPKIVLSGLPDYKGQILIEDTDHFGPDTAVIQNLFRQEITTPNCRSTFR